VRRVFTLLDSTVENILGVKRDQDRNSSENSPHNGDSERNRQREKTSKRKVERKRQDKTLWKKKFYAFLGSLSQRKIS
jgi:hypothetical protein